MKERSGKEIFAQLVGRIYGKKAPSFNIVNASIGHGDETACIITDVMNALTGKYRSRLGYLDEMSYKAIFGDARWRRDGFKVNLQFAEGHGPKPSDIVEAVADIGRRGSLPSDRHLLIYTTGDSEFFKRAARSGYAGDGVLNFDAIDLIDDEIGKQKTNIEQVQINQVSHYNTADLRFKSDGTVMICRIDGNYIITLLGFNDDEVYSFAYRDGRYEPIPLAHLVDSYRHINLIKESDEKRAYHFNAYDTFDINVFVTFNHNISESAFGTAPRYIEEFTLLDAANTPLDELFKLAIGVENGFTVFCNSRPNLKSDDVVEEAGLAWREGKYVSLTDSVQPGFSRSGTFMYKSENLKDLVVVSYNLLLEKEKS